MWLHTVMESRCEEQWRNKRSKEADHPPSAGAGRERPSSWQQEWEPDGASPPTGPRWKEREDGLGFQASPHTRLKLGEVLVSVRCPMDALWVLWLSCMCVSVSTEHNKPLASLLCLIPAEYQANVYSM